MRNESNAEIQQCVGVNQNHTPRAKQDKIKTIREQDVIVANSWH